MSRAPTAPPTAPDERFWQELLLGPASPELSDPEGGDAAQRALAWVLAAAERAQLPAAQRSFLREQGGQRLLVYRKLVRSTLRDAVTLALPRTCARLGERFDELFDGYCSERGPRSHFLRDVTHEVLAYWAEAWPARGLVAPYLQELARLEAVQLELAAHPDQPTALVPGLPCPSAEVPLDELSLERGARFIAAARLLSFEHAVHRLPAQLTNRSVPAPTPTHLFVYRDLTHRVRYLELSPLAAQVTRALLDGAPLGDAVTQSCARLALPLDEAVLAGTAQLLADLATRGALLGAASGLAQGGPPTPER